MKKLFTFLMAIPLMAATFTTRAAETVLDETDKSFSGWELYTIDAKSKLSDGQAFAAGDHIYVYSTARSDNNKNLQIGFYNATTNPDKNTPGFLVGKDNHNEEAYFLFGSDDYKNISESPYELTLTAEWAAGLNADGGKLLIRSDNLHLTKITWERPEAQVEKTVAEVWTGSFDTGDWSNSLKLEFYNAALEKGDDIIVTCSGDQIQIGYVETDGKNVYFNVNGNDYADLNGAKTYTYTLPSAAWADDLNAGQYLVINGKHLKVTAVAIKSKKTEDVAAVEVGKIVYDEILLDETGGTLSKWEDRYTFDVKAKLPEGEKFYPGDIIFVYSNASDGAKDFQTGFYNENGVDKTPGFVTGKDGSTTDAYYTFSDGNDYKSISESPYKVTLTQEWADALNDGNLFLVKSSGITIKKVTCALVGDRRDFTWIDLFVPGVYPLTIAGTDAEGNTVQKTLTDKQEYGTHENKGMDADLCDILGTAKMVEQEDGSWRLKFYEEWWTVNDIDQSQRKGDYKKGLGDDEANTFPLQIIRENTSNFSYLKVGDLIRITIKCRKTTDWDEGKSDNYHAEANLGTYKASIDFDDPHKDYVGLTINGNHASASPDYRDFGSTEDEKVIDYTITPDMLDHITRYGLTINGRLFELISVKAKIYGNGNNDNVTGREEHEYVYNHFFSKEELLTNGFDKNRCLRVTFNDGTDYNEVNTTIFDQNNTVIGTKTEEKTGTVPEDTQDKFQVAVRYMDNVNDVQAWNRLHRAAYLYEEHFTGETTAPASAPSRVKESVIENPHVVPIDGVLMVTSKDAAGSHLDIRVTDDALLDKIMESGLSVRGKMYNARLNGTGTLTGIDDIANDNDKIDFSAPYEVYNLQGQRVSAPSAGSLYIVRQGNKVEKVIIR